MCVCVHSYTLSGKRVCDCGGGRVFLDECPEVSVPVCVIACVSLGVCQDGVCVCEQATHMILENQSGGGGRGDGEKKQVSADD